jgi:hypothetical protein
MQKFLGFRYVCIFLLYGIAETYRLRAYKNAFNYFKIHFHY